MDKKISELDAVTTVDDADEYVLARSGATNKITGANLKAGVAGGGAQPVTEAAQYSGVNVSVGNGASGALDCQILDAGDDLLDITNPLLPVVRKDGLFAVHAQVQTAGGFTAGGVMTVDLTFDYTGAAVFVSDSVVGGANDYATLLISGTYKLTAGQAIQLLVTNGDGVSTRFFSLKNAFVSRVGPA